MYTNFVEITTGQAKWSFLNHEATLCHYNTFLVEIPAGTEVVGGGFDTNKILTQQYKKTEKQQNRLVFCNAFDMLPKSENACMVNTHILEQGFGKKRKFTNKRPLALKNDSPDSKAYFHIF